MCTADAAGPRVRETHTALLFFAGERVYKVKKPVDLGFVDFRTAAARRDAVGRELTLNRRLAPDVYLGVAQLAGPGPEREPLLVMRRMPEDRRLASLVTAKAPLETELRRIARTLVAFHARCRRGPEVSAEGSRDALLGRWQASFEQVRPFHGAVLPPADAAEVERLTLRFLAGREPLLAARAAGGFVLDGHGDLLADDIFCLPDGPRILDCLEFDDRLRYLDQIDDAAFLAMDLERLGAPDLAERFLAWYVEYGADPAPPALVRHYLAYRAFVRAKVACLRHAQGLPAAAEAAASLTALARTHLERGRVALVLVGGLPGTGKTTLAGGLADRFGWTRLSSDRVRKELAGIAPETAAPAGYREGIYTAAWTDHTYRELLSRAERLLGLGESVVLDASWTDPRYRELAAAVAERTSSDLVPLRCAAPAAVATGRLAGRRGPSDADAAVAGAMGAADVPWPAARTVDTAGTPESALAEAAATVAVPR